MSEGFIYTLVGAESGKVKVGFSENPEQRYKQIQQGLNERVELIGYAPGTRWQEKRLHRLLAPLRVRGEWYCSLEAVRNKINDAMAGYEAAERGVLDPRGIA